MVILTTEISYKGYTEQEAIHISSESKISVQSKISQCNQHGRRGLYNRVACEPIILSQQVYVMYTFR